MGSSPISASWIVARYLARSSSCGIEGRFAPSMQYCMTRCFACPAACTVSRKTPLMAMSTLNLPSGVPDCTDAAMIRAIDSRSQREAKGSTCNRESHLFLIKVGGVRLKGGHCCPCHLAISVIDADVLVQQQY